MLLCEAMKDKKQLPYFIFLALTLVWLLAAVYGDRWVWPFPVFSYLPPLVVVTPGAICMAWTIARILRGLRKPGEITALLFFAFLSSRILGWQWDMFYTNTSQQDVRVMTFNVHLHSREVPKALEMVQELKPDVIFLQENLGGDSSPASYLRSKLDGWHMVQDGDVAILSRWPLSNVHSSPLSSVPGRVILSAKVHAPHPFTGLTTHWSVPQWRQGMEGLKRTVASQQRDFDDTRNAVFNVVGPVIFGGDLNNPPNHSHVRTLSNEFQNAFGKVGNGVGWTFPDRFPLVFPLVRIDHLFSSPEYVPIRCWVGPSSGSDHHSLIADFRWKSENH